MFLADLADQADFFFLFNLQNLRENIKLCLFKTSETPLLTKKNYVSMRLKKFQNNYYFLPINHFACVVSITFSVSS